MKIQIKNNQFIYVNPNYYKELDLNKLDYSNIKNKNELYRFLNVMKREHQSRIIISNKLKDISIKNISFTEYQYDNIDAFATSAVTYMFNEKCDEDILLEFKYRSDVSSSHYDSVTIDNNKYDLLKRVSNQIKKRIMVCYLFKDGNVRVLDLFKCEPDLVLKNKTVKKNRFSDEYKVVDLYCFNNDRTILI